MDEILANVCTCTRMYMGGMCEGQVLMYVNKFRRRANMYIPIWLKQKMVKVVQPFNTLFYPWRINTNT
jgi:hypothetical protein